MTDTQRLAMKAIRKAEDEVNHEKALFLRSFWKVSEQNQFIESPPSAGQVSAHASMELSAAACTASHRESNQWRNIICFVAAEMLTEVGHPSGCSECDSNSEHSFGDGGSHDEVCFEEPPYEEESEAEDQDIDAEIWHARSVGFGFDEPDARCNGGACGEDDGIDQPAPNKASCA